MKPLIDTKKTNHGGMAANKVSMAPHDTGNGNGPSNPANKAVSTGSSESTWCGSNRGKAMYPNGHVGSVGN